MAFAHGRNTVVWWNSADITGYLDNTDLSIDMDAGETTTYGKTWKTYLAGLVDATVGFTGKYDATGGNAIEAQLGTDAGVLTYAPPPGTAGARARLVSATGATYSESSPVGDIVTFAWDVQSQTIVGLGWVQHAFTEDTNTTTGSSIDGTAATTTGWTAHLHVSAVDGGSWVVKLEDSADNSNWADVTSGAFTAATGATSQRLASASGATLRRYTRYTATRTGGSAGDGITFGLAIARMV